MNSVDPAYFLNSKWQVPVNCVTQNSCLTGAIMLGSLCVSGSPQLPLFIRSSLRKQEEMRCPGTRISVTHRWLGEGIEGRKAFPENGIAFRSCRLTRVLAKMHPAIWRNELSRLLQLSSGIRWNSMHHGSLGIKYCSCLPIYLSIIFSSLNSPGLLEICFTCSSILSLLGEIFQGLLFIFIDSHFPESREWRKILVALWRVFLKIYINYAWKGCWLPVHTHNQTWL